MSTETPEDLPRNFNRADWITIKEAATLTRRSRATIYRWLPELRQMRPLRTLYVHRGDVTKLEVDNTANIGRPKSA